MGKPGMSVDEIKNKLQKQINAGGFGKQLVFKKKLKITKIIVLLHS